MAERQRPALGTDPLGIEPERGAAGQHLPGEGLVELDHVEVVERQAGAVQRELRGRDDAQAGSVRGDPGGRGRQHAQAGHAEAAMRAGVDGGDQRRRRR